MLTRVLERNEMSGRERKRKNTQGVHIDVRGDFAEEVICA